MLSGADEDGVPWSLSVLSGRFDGTFDHRAGVTGDPEPPIPEGVRIVSIACKAPENAGASVIINGKTDQAINVEAGTGFSISPEGKLAGQAVKFVGTASYVVELVVMEDQETPDA